MAEENAPGTVGDENEVRYNRLVAHVKKNAECSVCKKIPTPDDLYHCSKGHLLCELCIIELLVQEPYENMSLNCPICQVHIDFEFLSYNMAIRDVIRELPHKCEQCNGMFIRKELELHMKEKCLARHSECRYGRIGCPWTGPYNQLAEHEGICTYPNMKGKDIVQNIHKLNKIENRKYDESIKIYNSLSWECIFTDDILLNYEFLTNSNRIAFVSSRFFAFEEEWTITVRINDALHNLERGGIKSIAYKLERCTTTKRYPFKMQYYITSCPSDRRNIITCVHKHIFYPQNCSPGYKLLDIDDAKQRNLLLVQKEIWLRLYMFYKLH